MATSKQAKTLWETKTFWLNLVAGILVALEELGKTDAIPHEYMPLAYGFVAFANIVLRAYTSKPVEVRSIPNALKSKDK